MNVFTEKMNKITEMEVKAKRGPQLRPFMQPVVFRISRT